MDLARDVNFMRHAMELGRQARLNAPPNPWVGCVLVKDDQIIGEGFTSPPGEAHAEINALKSAKELGNDPADSTAYVTLEPCSHWGRTPPCINALVQAKIKRVVIGVGDPDVNVNGQGINLLREAGIQVSVGVLEKEIKKELAPYLYHRNTGLPYCVLKAAVSMDGRIASSDYSSQWISSAEAREEVHLLRSQSQAIMIGINTALHDSPKLTVRNIATPLKSPLRIIVDPNGRLVKSEFLFDQSLAPTLILTSRNTSKDTKKIWQDNGVEIAEFKTQNQKIKISDILEYLGKRGIVQLLIEGGRGLYSEFIKSHHVQQLQIYYGNCLLGNEGIPFMDNLGISNMSQAPRFHLAEAKVLGNTLRGIYLNSA